MINKTTLQAQNTTYSIWQLMHGNSIIWGWQINWRKNSIWLKTFLNKWMLNWVLLWEDSRLKVKNFLQPFVLPFSSALKLSTKLKEKIAVSKNFFYSRRNKELGLNFINCSASGRIHFFRKQHAGLMLDTWVALTVELAILFGFMWIHFIQSQIIAYPCQLLVDGLI